MTKDQDHCGYVEAEDTSVVTVGLLGAVLERPVEPIYVTNARLLEIERRILRIEKAIEHKIGIEL